MEKNPALPTLQNEEKRHLLEWAEKIIQQRQYETLEALTPCSVDALVSEIRPEDVTCLFRVSELVFRREEGCLDRFTTVLNALHAADASCLMLLQCQCGKSELYLGAVNKQRYDNPFYTNTIRDILRTSLEGNLPGTELKELVSKKDIALKLDQLLNNGFDSQCVTAVSCVAGEPSSDPEKANQGIERLLEAVDRQNFTLMVLADPVSRDQMRIVRQGYQDLSTQLSANSEVSLSLQSGTSLTLSESRSKTTTTTMSESISFTQSHTSGTGWSSSSGRSASQNDAAMKLKKGAAAAAALTFSENPLFAMNLFSSIFINPSQTSDTDGQSGSENVTDGTQHAQNKSVATGTNMGTSNAFASNEGVTIQTTTKNRHTQELLERVDWYLDWLNRCENYGMFNCCAYVLSSNAGTNLMVASQYQALMQGNGEMSQPVTINTWTKETGSDRIKQALLHMQHPVLRCNDLNDGLSPAMLMSSMELSRQIALPQHSVVGISVMEYASFGREVVRKTPLKNGKVLRVGSISHMGKTIPHQPVLLDVQSLAAHTFVAGTNGSGKSNTVFKILEELMGASIPFMVIEPAKGEYKNVFGRDTNVNVYGTNRRKTPLLRLNPFWFNEDVDVLEHIDKLVDVFNASWPMYAAMPAVLKSAIESAYRSCGWDLKRSVCKGGYRIFPTVQDVLGEFNQKMDSTAFSEEVKGNYVGALSTRLESLCNGIYGEIFGGQNLTDHELFDSNVIIDLSRVGSAETKSMIMGMLVIRLQEYRMSSDAMNLSLKHITVLEEAHHLLRRTSAAQSEDGANMLGKSVEMISNAIAEMRSYGEGFIIVDQSPGLMDLSVMRNTNTKMILRLPEAGDREMVGNTMGLAPEQIYELSRLKTGVCAIYQKDWLEAVLCQVDRANHEEAPFSYQDTQEEDTAHRTAIVKALLAALKSTSDEPDVNSLSGMILNCGIPGAQKKALLRELTAHKPDLKLRKSLICELAEFELELPQECSRASVAEWYDDLSADNALLDRWGEHDLPLILPVLVEQLADQDPAWAEVQHLLPGPFAARDQSLRESRGRALARLCPLNCKEAPLTDSLRKELEEDHLRLMNATELDRQIAALLRASLDQGVIRQRNQLKPYTDIVWELMGGQARWDALYPLLQQNNLSAWNQSAGEILRMRVAADPRTQVSLLGLFLQRKGALPCVKSSFSAWRTLALSPKKDP